VARKGDGVGAPERVRLDRWLWAARAFKTRSQAGRACGAGRVQVNGDAAKAARQIEPGDRVEIRGERGVRTLEVKALSATRGPASVAQTLYEDHTPPAEAPKPRIGKRPSGKELRQMRRLRGR